MLECSQDKWIIARVCTSAVHINSSCQVDFLRITFLYFMLSCMHAMVTNPGGRGALGRTSFDARIAFNPLKNPLEFVYVFLECRNAIIFHNLGSEILDFTIFDISGLN